MGTLGISDTELTLSSGPNIMNTHQMTLILAAATFFSLCSGFINPLIDGISISLPMLGVSSTVGLNTVLATLGALKLGAALALLISNHEKEAESYSTVEE